MSLVVGLFVFYSLYHFFELSHYLTFDYIKSNQEIFRSYFSQNSTLTILVFFCSYVVVAALSIPGGTIMSLVGGAIFGFLNGLVIISFASTVGATLAFLISRTLLRDYIQNKYQDIFITINQGVETDGVLYLLSLRLNPLFPFFLINLVMGLTRINVFKYFIVSQVGMLAGTAIYVNAGVQLSKLESLSGIISLEIFGTFLLLSLFPIIVKRIYSFKRG